MECSLLASICMFLPSNQLPSPTYTTLWNISWFISPKDGLIGSWSMERDLILKHHPVHHPLHLQLQLKEKLIWLTISLSTPSCTLTNFRLFLVEHRRSSSKYKGCSRALVISSPTLGRRRNAGSIWSQGRFLHADGIACVGSTVDTWPFWVDLVVKRLEMDDWQYLENVVAKCWVRKEFREGREGDMTSEERLKRER
uniref:Uncharacterized protein n=1 Tax=Tanacetum cinerariifolium TaxID=118510 RepID=A0A6L2LSY6_TANCI|nr:hypothetical protein [Tanacetum cinerariifolium]